MSIYFLNQFYMIYEFMRLVLFFDLPMKTKKEVKIYTHFRKAAVKHVNILKKNVPKEGQIRLLLVTEKQYSKIEIIVGGVSNQEKTVNADSFIKL